MQTPAAATRMSALAQAGHATLNRQASQLVLDDPRLRGWVATASGGSWATPTTTYSIATTTSGDYLKHNTTAWDWAYADLGANTAVTLPDGTTHGNLISHISLGGNRDLVVFYANRLFGSYLSGVYAVRVYDDGAGNLAWSQPSPVFDCPQVDDGNGQTKFFVAFPRLQTINSEYWVVALECSLYAGVETYHLCYSRSTDGENWTDREYLAGASTDASQENVGLNSYLSGATPTAFTKNDLLDAYLSVDGNTTYIISRYGASNFQCDSTSLVGITNSGQQLDVTGNTASRRLSLPAAPTSVQGIYTVQNSGQVYNNHALLEGGVTRLLHQAGYVTSEGNELITLATEVVDEIRQFTEITDEGAQNYLDLTTGDYSIYLRDWHADVFWEYFSPKTAAYDDFCNTGALTPVYGGYSVDSDNRIAFAAVDPNATYLDTVAYLHEQRTSDGSMEVSWRITRTLTGHYAGVIVQGEDNPVTFWSVIYNGTTDTFQLRQAVPTGADLSHQQYRYETAVDESGTQSLSEDTWYVLKVAQWHRRIMAWHGTAFGSWTKVIDYTAPLGGMKTDAAYWGLVGKSSSSQSGALGNTPGTNGVLMDMSDGSNHPKYFALRVQTGAKPSSLKQLGILAGQTGMPPALTLGLAYDNGSGTAPKDLTSAANVVFKTSLDPQLFAGPTSPMWQGTGIEGDVPLTASTYYWVFCTFNADLSAGQSWQWLSNDPNANTYGADLTKQSTDGATWSSLSNTNKNLSACLFVEYDEGTAEFGAATTGSGALYWSSAEMPQTMDRLARAIATKASVLGYATDALALSDFAADADGYSYTSSTYGDVLIDLVGSTTSYYEIVLREQSPGDSAATGYRVQLLPATQQLKIIEPGGATLYLSESLTYLDTAGVSLRLVNWGGWLYVYNYEALVGLTYIPNLSTVGYLALDSAGGETWSSARVPNLTPIKPYFAIETNQNGLQALDNLLSKTRYKYFFQYDGALRISSFPRSSSVATYEATVMEGENVSTGRYSVNHLTPGGGTYYATRFDAEELDRTGRRHFQLLDYTDAYTNEEAYQAGALPLRAAKERAKQYSTNLIPPDLSLEREDRITIVNDQDGTSRDYVVNDLDLEISIDPPAANQRVGLRLFV